MQDMGLKMKTIWSLKKEREMFLALIGASGKGSACHVGDLGSIPGSGRCPGEGNGNPLQYLAWRIPMTEETGGWHHKSHNRS